MLRRGERDKDVALPWLAPKSFGPGLASQPAPASLPASLLEASLPPCAGLITSPSTHATLSTRKRLFRFWPANAISFGHYSSWRR